MTLDQSKLDVLLADLGQAVRRSHARHRRRRMVGTIAVLITALVVSVAAAGTADDWWTNAQPPASPSAVEASAVDNAGLIAIDLSKKALVASIPGSQLDAVATKSGGYCLIAIHDGRTVDSACDDTPVKPDGTGSRYTSETSDVSTPATRGWWIGYGRITDARAASIDLSTVGLSASVPVERGGFFLFDIPQAQWSHVADRAGAITIDDADGKTIRTGCIYTGLAPGKWPPGGGGLDISGDGCNDYRYVPPPEVDYTKAHKVAEVTFKRTHGFVFVDGKPVNTAGLTMGLWQTTDRAGDTCMLYAAASERPTPPLDANHNVILTGNPAGTIGCAKDIVGTFNVGVSSELDAGEYTEMVTGVFDPRSGITKLALVAADGTRLAITYGGNGFLAELPNAPRDGKGPGAIPGGPYTIVGYDNAGRTVASQRIPAKPVPGKYERPFIR